MHCKHSWDLFFINKVLPRNYIINDWKSSRSQLLFNREKSYFPQTLPFVAIEIEKDKIALELKNIEDQLIELKMQKNYLNNKLLDLNKNHKSITNDKFSIRQCPTPNCKGFLDQDSCILCHKKSCLQCNTNILENTHECKQEDIDTWKQIVKSSKPCPNCGTRIQKSSGCSQMWCLGCHVAFNWNTGLIEKGPIHNPHYYEWAEHLGHRQGAIANEPCDGRRVWNIYNFYNVNVEDRSRFKKLHQKLNHVINHELLLLREKTQNKNNMDLRIQFLRDLINEQEYKRKLISREIQYQKNIRLIDTLDTMSMFVVELLTDFLKNKIDFQEFENKIMQIKNFANTNITEINNTFHSKIGYIIL
jgi:hypothetical protein